MGAAGNIASTYAQMVAPQVREVVLVVRDTSDPRVARVGRVGPGRGPAHHLHGDRRPRGADPLLVDRGLFEQPATAHSPAHLGRGPVVICDISVPSDVTDPVALERPDVHVIRGGVVRLPLDPTFEIGGITLPRGHSLACMAETLLMGLDGATGHWSVGSVTVDGVERTMAAASAA